jgi:anaphase-promoting complex subunit 6
MAEKYFYAALRQVKVVSDGNDVSEKWEPLLNNLGHTCRKLRRFEEALAFHRQALVSIL